jgi:hypothetical protein
VAGSRLSIASNVIVPRPTRRSAMPIHQFGAFTSFSPRGLPWLLNITQTTPSCMKVHLDGAGVSC